MLDQLWEFLTRLGSEALPVATVPPWEKGIMLRCDKFHRVLEPGWHWKIPVFDSYITHPVVTTTQALCPQTIVTKDGRELTIEAVARYEIEDIRAFLLEVHDQKDAVQDLTEGVIARLIMSRTWEEIRAEDIENEISIKARAAVKRWGVKLDRVIITTLAPVRAIRLIGARVEHHAEPGRS